MYYLAQFGSIIYDKEQSKTNAFECLVRDDEKKFFAKLSDEGWIYLQEIWLNLERGDQKTTEKYTYFEHEIKYFLQKYDN